MTRGRRLALLMALAASLAVSAGSVVAQDDQAAEASMGATASMEPAASMASMAPMPIVDAATLGPGLHVVNPWSRESTMVDLAGAAFMLLVNSTQADDALVGASSPAAATVEIHQTTAAEDGTMVMAPVEEVPIPAGGVAELKPGGYHVMLIDLVAPLVAGEQIELTLEFASAESQTVMVPIQALGPMDTSMDDSMDDMGDDSMEPEESEGPDSEG